MKQLEIGFENESGEPESLEELAAKLAASGDYKIIKRFSPVSRYCADKNVAKKTAIYLDTETTGMSAEKDKIIELAMVPFEYDEDGNIYRVLPAYNALQDPGFPIPAIITQITHITDEMVKGEAIDWSEVGRVLSSAELVIAHNAGFDRPFVENACMDFQRISWACSIKDIEWAAEGFEGVKLEYLAYKHGFFYEGHRATIDCQAGIEILSRTLPNSGQTALAALLKHAKRVDVRVWAENAPFERKEKLKERGYYWSPGDNGKRKAWFKDIPEALLEEEMTYLKREVYSKPVKTLPMDRLSAKERYSQRV